MVFSSGTIACKESCKNRLGLIVRAVNRHVENGANEAICHNGSRSAAIDPRIRDERSQLWQSRGLGEKGGRRNATNEANSETKKSIFAHPKSGPIPSLGCMEQSA
jgi:hypothetical protein